MGGLSSQRESWEIQAEAPAEVTPGLLGSYGELPANQTTGMRRAVLNRCD